MDYVQVIIGIPGSSWGAILKMSKLSLNLLQILTCKYSLTKIQAMVQKDVFSKLILNIQNNYENYIMIIL